MTFSRHREERSDVAIQLRHVRGACNSSASQTLGSLDCHVGLTASSQ